MLKIMHFLLLQKMAQLLFKNCCLLANSVSGKCDCILMYLQLLNNVFFYWCCKYLNSCQATLPLVILGLPQWPVQIYSDLHIAAVQKLFAPVQLSSAVAAR